MHDLEFGNIKLKNSSGKLNSDATGTYQHLNLKFSAQSLKVLAKSFLDHIRNKKKIDLGEKDFPIDKIAPIDKLSKNYNESRSLS